MIEVFRTSVTDATIARNIIEKIKLHYPALQVNFDLSDCDRILRVKALGDVPVEEILSIVLACGVEISVLEDIIG